jgi:DNA-binding NtrC family response regulator
MSILVVDDHRDVADFIAEALREIEDLDVDVAESAEEARAQRQRKGYEMYIIDVYLKGGDWSPDGLTLAKDILQEKADTPILLMTGKSFSRIITDVIVRTGTTQLLSKPITLETLLKKVRLLRGKGEAEDAS